MSRVEAMTIASLVSLGTRNIRNRLPYLEVQWNILMMSSKFTFFLQVYVLNMSSK